MSDTMEISSYEQSREQRIRENLERMQKLGIVDLSLKLKSLQPTPNRRSLKRTPQSATPSLPKTSGPVRRSSRLQNSTPVSYSEVKLSKSVEDVDGKLMREVGAKPEVYDEEHDKLLGSTEVDWTLFVDGYGKDGKRIYDPVRGKTCHQCRQKTLGHRTHCSTCNMVQGQFCGDCLYMRYGENVLEANQNPNWMCPVCRGICNCSLCRQAKGWPPTGTLYRKISGLGYKSVAHYLIQTRRANKDSDKGDIGSKAPGSTDGTEHNLSGSENEKGHILVDIKLEKLGSNLSFENEKGSLLVDIKFGESTSEPLPEPEIRSPNLSCANEEDINLVDIRLDQSITEPLPVPEKYGSTCGNEEGSTLVDEIKLDESITEPLPESEKYGSTLSCGNEEGILVDAIKLDESVTKLKACAEKKSTPDVPNDSLINNTTGYTPMSETSEGDNSKEMKKEEINVGSITTPKSTKKRVVLAPPTPDSVAGRLRQRRINTDEEHSTKETEVATSDIIAGSSRKKRNASIANGGIGSVTDSIATRLKMRRRA